MCCHHRQWTRTVKIALKTLSITVPLLHSSLGQRAWPFVLNSVAIPEKVHVSALQHIHLNTKRSHHTSCCPQSEKLTQALPPPSTSNDRLSTVTHKLQEPVERLIKGRPGGLQADITCDAVTAAKAREHHCENR